MGLKTFKPRSEGLRHRVAQTFEEITEQKPLRKLTQALKSSAGRNNQGRITTRHRGGGVKRRYRIVDFRRDKIGIPARVEAIAYDPNRTANLALLKYVDGEKRYILAPHKLVVGTQIISSESAPIKVGNALTLENIPAGSIVHNIEMKPGKGGQISRSAGAGAQIMAKEGDYVTLKLPSGEMRMIHKRCRATLGEVGNKEHENISIGKAGRSRWMGRRPKVRGVAMNPVDHPMGGGEGRSSGGRHPTTPWGKPTKGFKTRKKNKASNKYIVARRKKK